MGSLGGLLLRCCKGGRPVVDGAGVVAAEIGSVEIWAVENRGLSSAAAGVWTEGGVMEAGLGTIPRSSIYDLRLGSFSRFSFFFCLLRSGRTTMTGTGEF